MIHRLALLMGGAGAAGVLALALALGGFGAPLRSTPDAFVPLANDALGGGQITQVAPTDPAASSLGGGNPDAAVRKVIDTVYVVPAPTARVTHAGKPRGDNSPSGDNNAGNTNGDDNAGNTNGDDNQAGEYQGDDQSQAGEDDQSGAGDQSDDGGAGDDGQEPGDD